jgi:hypothetical protein
MIYALPLVHGWPRSFYLDEFLLIERVSKLSMCLILKAWSRTWRDEIELIQCFRTIGHNLIIQEIN